MDNLGGMQTHVRDVQPPRLPMGSFRPTRAASVALIALAVLGGAIEARAQAPAPKEGSLAFSTSEASWEGLTEFVRAAQRELGTERFRIVFELDFEQLTPRDALVVVHPEVQLDVASLTAWLSEGGRLALLDDYGTSPALLETFGIRRTAAPINPRFSLRGDPELAIARPLVEHLTRTAQTRHPMVQGVERVVTNHPVVFQHPDLTTFLELERNDGSAAALAVTGVIAGKGRLIAVGDPSVFINLMLRYPGNRQLEAGLLHYLLDRERSDTVPAGPAGRVWLVSNRFVQKGRYGGPESAEAAIGRQLGELKEAAWRARDEGLPSAGWLLIAGVLAVWLIARELTSRGRPRLPVLPSFARPDSLALQAGAAARAELLSSRTTSPLLAVLEMETALREALLHRLSDASNVSRDIKAQLRSAGLMKPDELELERLLSEFAQLSGTLPRRRPARPSAGQLKQLHGRSVTMLAALRRARGEQ